MNSAGDEGRVVSLARILPMAAASDPTRTAIVDTDRSWTFEEADRQAGRLATALLDCGVVTGDRVGVHFRKSAAGFLAMHAVVRIGAVAVPLDPGSPADRLARIVDELDISTLMSHDPLGTSVRALCEDADVTAVIGIVGPVPGTRTIDESELAGMDPAPAGALSADDRAYVITTSGSTGEPKGIVHTHGSAMAYAQAAGRHAEMTSDDRVADVAPHHFDISTFALWSAPCHRAAIVVVPEAHQSMPASQSALLAHQSVTIWYSVPFLLQQLVRRGDLSSRDLSSLRLIQFGGEVMSPSVLAEAMKALPHTRFSNIYGPAEVNHCSAHDLDAPPAHDEIVPIGRPWSIAEFRVTEPGAPAPDDRGADSGELWVASTTMMEGYFGRSQAESGIVVADGWRWYRTGDLVARDDDGVYEFLGRTDHQVKVRGFRVELEAVEGALEDLDHVSSVVAAVRRHEDEPDRIVAGVLKPEAGFDHDSFLTAARRCLPPYMAPTQVVILSGELVTGSGKLDRRRLRQQTLFQVEGLAGDK